MGGLIVVPTELHAKYAYIKSVQENEMHNYRIDDGWELIGPSSNGGITRHEDRRWGTYEEHQPKTYLFGRLKNFVNDRMDRAEIIEEMNKLKNDIRNKDSEIMQLKSNESNLCSKIKRLEEKSLFRRIFRGS